MSSQFSPQRKAAFYFGSALMYLGALLFFSTFVTFAMHFGDFSSDFKNVGQSVFLRAFSGILLLTLGSMVRTIGARGLAGSGIILDPQQARSNLEPYSRMAGGMLRDALNETDLRSGAAPEQVVLIRCRECDTLNPETAKFCQECGTRL